MAVLSLQETVEHINPFENIRQKTNLATQFMSIKTFTNESWFWWGLPHISHTCGWAASRTQSAGDAGLSVRPSHCKVWSTNEHSELPISSGSQFLLLHPEQHAAPQASSWPLRPVNGWCSDSKQRWEQHLAWVSPDHHGNLSLPWPSCCYCQQRMTKQKLLQDIKLSDVAHNRWPHRFIWKEELGLSWITSSTFTFRAMS